MNKVFMKSTFFRGGTLALVAASIAATSGYAQQPPAQPVQPPQDQIRTTKYIYVPELDGGLRWTKLPGDAITSNPRYKKLRDECFALQEKQFNEAMANAQVAEWAKKERVVNRHLDLVDNISGVLSEEDDQRHLGPSVTLRPDPNGTKHLSVIFNLDKTHKCNVASASQVIGQVTQWIAEKIRKDAEAAKQTAQNGVPNKDTPSSNVEDLDLDNFLKSVTKDIKIDRPEKESEGPGSATRPQ